MTLAADLARLSTLLLDASILAKKAQIGVEAEAAGWMAKARMAAMSPPDPGPEPEPPAPPSTAAAPPPPIEAPPAPPIVPPLPRHAPRRPPRTWDLDGEKLTAQQLADKAGSTLWAMYARLRHNDARTAVDLGANASQAIRRLREVQASGAQSAPPPPPPPPPPAAPPAAAFPASVFDAPRAAVPAPASHGPRVASAQPRAPAPQPYIPPTPAPAPKPPPAEVIEPPGVKRTFGAKPETAAETPSTFGRIGQYEDTGSAIERALRGDR